MSLQVLEEMPATLECWNMRLTTDGGFSFKQGVQRRIRRTEIKFYGRQNFSFVLKGSPAAPEN